MGGVQGLGPGLLPEARDLGEGSWGQTSWPGEREAGSRGKEGALDRVLGTGTLPAGWGAERGHSCPGKVLRGKGPAAWVGAVLGGEGLLEARA